MIEFRPVALVPDVEPGRCAYRETDAASGATVRCPEPARYVKDGWRVCKAHRDRPSGVLGRELVPVTSEEREQRG